jgi:hypothetical protein
MSELKSLESSVGSTRASRARTYTKQPVTGQIAAYLSVPDGTIADTFPIPFGDVTLLLQTTGQPAIMFTNQVANFYRAINPASGVETALINFLYTERMFGLRDTAPQPQTMYSQDVNKKNLDIWAVANFGEDCRNANKDNPKSYYRILNPASLFDRIFNGKIDFPGVPWVVCPGL